MSTALRYTARSDMGLVRQNNEDSAYAGPRLLALADGMGGHAAGEVASQFIVYALAPLDEDQPGTDLTGALADAMHLGNDAIAGHVEANPELSGMGCTLTAMLFDGKRVGLLHVGDSRAYLMRDGELSQITRDDTFVQSLVEEGKLSADEASSHPQRSLILKALTGEPVEPTTTVREVRVGDRYLLCSDGLSDPVSFSTISETLAEGTPDEAADRLVQLALRSGGPDNITIVVADVVDDAETSNQPVIVGAASGEAPPGDFSNTAAGRAAAFSRSRSAATDVTPPPDAADTGEPARRPSASRSPRGRKRSPGSRGLPDELEEDDPPPSGSRWKFALSVVAVVAVLAGVGVVSALLIRSNYFVAENDNQVVVMRGISGEILGVDLAGVDRVACLSDDDEVTLHDPEEIPTGCNVLTLGDLREPARGPVLAGMPAGSSDEADAQILRLTADNLLPPCSELEAEAAEAERVAQEEAEAAAGDDDPAADGDSADETPAPVGPEPVPGENCRSV